MKTKIEILDNQGRSHGEAEIDATNDFLRVLKEAIAAANLGEKPSLMITTETSFFELIIDSGE